MVPALSVSGPTEYDAGEPSERSGCALSTVVYVPVRASETIENHPPKATRASQVTREPRWTDADAVTMGPCTPILSFDCPGSDGMDPSGSGCSESARPVSFCCT